MATTTLPGIAATAISISVREQHLQQLLQRRPPLPFIEILADNYLSLRGPHYHALCQLAEHYPIVLHCVGLSIGSGGAAVSYLAKIKTMADEIDAIAISDHLSASELNGVNSHDLLPISYQQQFVEPLCASIGRVQDYFKRPFILENVSRYLSYPDDQLNEGVLLTQLVQKTGIGLLFDINNLFVTAHNLNLNSDQMLANLPLSAVSYYHLGGHQQQGQLLLDNHGSKIAEPVWQLYQQVLTLIGPKPTIIEWDNNIPPLEALFDEANKAHQLMYTAATRAAL
ncbi:DUF692 domain-containing protein [Ferrimonas lipolytica]|uniref:DUF692 domain-containing protein n=1 Tax=Ferrimonas lipolytica TaxID=2724191 RepID=A0A6H1UEQ4_9GAMM|nr:DUF692 domain-containing protein [Ferrimonas lipolytica]QIZ77109.1 DUF692 domain-containing protein [Ferrimonas lipolytica]